MFFFTSHGRHILCGKTPPLYLILRTGSLTHPTCFSSRPSLLLQIAYLDKLIMLVGNSLNTLVDARPAKIVAGLESENTNRLLQLLALAAIERPDSSRYTDKP